MALKRAAMAGVTALVTVNIWTGCPLLALWVGSRAVGTNDLSMAAVLVVLVVLGALEFATTLVLAWLTNTYDEMIGLPRMEPRATWTRRLCAPESAGLNRRLGISSLEGIVVINVYVAVVTLIVWYLFFAPHPAPLLCAIHC
ncbi:MAG TPA: hypothetical protein VK761_00195 [Solirubrobacteraceae bacterium]|jgi:hypothetical protein|nr:hypothetical protein [Solirubrobacteraceae bacterium]